MAQGFSLKDQLFNRDKIAGLGARLAAAWPGFDATGFLAEVMADLPDLALKQRITRIAEALEAQLPGDYAQALDVILRALPPPLDPALSDDDFGDFIYAPLGAFVARNGLSQDRLEASLAALQQITQRFSVEFDIRPFLNAFPGPVMAAFEDWASHPHYHVRRLVSEGTRPKLPWGIAIDLAPGAALPLLDRLHADPTRYVTRSVANHLNDIAKTDPMLVVDCLRNWQAQGRQSKAELDWMARHALRTLVKQGHPQALALLDFGPNPPITLGPLRLERDSLAIGEVLAFELPVVATDRAPLLVDFTITLQRARGTGEKTFKLKTLELKPGQKVTLSKRHRFVKGATTITYYPGPHSLHIQVNGQRVASADFTLTD